MSSKEHKLTSNQISYVKQSKTSASKLAKRYGVHPATIRYHRDGSKRHVTYHKAELKKLERNGSKLTISLEEESFIKSLPILFKNVSGDISFEIKRNSL